MTTVSGIIRDTQGNALPGLSVTIRYTRPLVGFDGGAAVQNVRSFTTSGTGLLTMPDLVPGHYEIFISIQANASTSATLLQKGTMVVLTEGPMSLEAALDSTIGEITPTILQQAAQAAADAQTAADTAVSAAAGVEFPVSYAEQTLTAPQQAQARANTSALGYRSADITVTVGSGGDFASIPAALESLSATRMLYKDANVFAAIRILSGYQIPEGINVFGGQDLSWITIVSDDAAVEVADGFTGSIENDIFLIDNSRAPVIGTVFDGRYLCRNGIKYQNNSTGLILPECGFSNCQGYTLDVVFGSYVAAQQAIMDGSQMTRNVHVTHASVLDFNFGKVLNSTNTGLYASHGGRINAQFSEVVTSGGDAAVHANHGACIDFFNGTADTCVRGVYARHGSTVSAQLSTVIDASSRGYHALGASRIAADKSRIEGAGASGYFAQNASFIDAQESVIVGAMSENAIRAQGGSTINAEAIEVESAPGTHNAYALFLSNINIENAVFVGSGSHGVFANRGSDINCQGATIPASGGSAIYAFRGSRINAAEATATGASDHGAYSRDGSSINLDGANVQKGASPDTGATTADIRARQGSTINAHAATGGANIATNTLTADGIIYR